MTTINRVRVEHIEGPRLRCFVDHVYAFHWNTSLIASRTMALHLLWESLWAPLLKHEMTWEQAQAVRKSTLLYRALDGDRMDGHNLTDQVWNRSNVGRFISCVGVTDRRNCENWPLDLSDPRYDDDEDNNLPTPCATFHIAVTDPRFLAHLAPGAEWDSTSWDHDRPAPFKEEWRTPDVTLVARAIDASQDFSGLPILADALQEAGCDSDDLLAHFRDPDATHVRGCWALDLVLGKE